MSVLSIIILIFLLLVSSFFLSLFSASFRKFHKKTSQKQFKTFRKRYFYRYLLNAFFPKQEYEGTFFSLICTQNMVRFAYAVLAFACVLALGLHDANGFILLAVFALLFFLIGDYIPRVLGMKSAEWALRFSASAASLLMSLVFPFTYVFLSILQGMSRTVYFDNLHEPTVQAKQEIIDIIQESELNDTLDTQDKKLISSVLTFKQHLAREIMVPRVDVFGLTAETTIKEAAGLLQTEGYSRIPVYRGNMDNIIGVLMYKDVLQKYKEYEQNGNEIKILEAPIESIMKAPLYTPETIRISNLLQEFRKKQVHIAIVVDEYGGTEGIVTIEDILERIVGEIEDEYDNEEEVFYTQTEGGWIVDARLSILDAEEQLGINIPQEGEYDTIGGYIFHCAGTIPSKGFVIHHDEFELMVLRSTDRCVEKVRIKPTSNIEKIEEEE